jgi:hypothetical protein
MRVFLSVVCPLEEGINLIGRTEEERQRLVDTKLEHLPKGPDERLR